MSKRKEVIQTLTAVAAIGLVVLICVGGIYLLLPATPQYPVETPRPLLPTFTPKPLYADYPKVVPGLTIQSKIYGISYRVEYVTTEKCSESLAVLDNYKSVVYFTTNRDSWYGQPTWSWVCVPVGVTGDYYRDGLTVHAEAVSKAGSQLYLVVPEDWQVIYP